MRVTQGAPPPSPAMRIAWLNAWGLRTASEKLRETLNSDLERTLLTLFDSFYPLKSSAPAPKLRPEQCDSAVVPALLQHTCAARENEANGVVAR